MPLGCQYRTVQSDYELNLVRYILIHHTLLFYNQLFKVGAANLPRPLIQLLRAPRGTERNDIPRSYYHIAAFRRRRSSHASREVEVGCRRGRPSHYEYGVDVVQVQASGGSLERDEEWREG